MGASVGVHLAIIGAVVALTWSEAPAPLPIIQVDLVQESSGAYRRALARALSGGLPVLEVRVVRNANQKMRTARPAAEANHPLPSLGLRGPTGATVQAQPPPSRGRELPLESRVHLLTAASSIQSDTPPPTATPLVNPLPPCGGGLGRGECLNNLPPPPRPVVPAATAREVVLASAALPEVKPAPTTARMKPLAARKDVVEDKNKTNTPSLTLPPCGGGLGRGGCLEHVPPTKTIARLARVQSPVVEYHSPKDAIQPTVNLSAVTQSNSWDDARRPAPRADAVEDATSIEVRASPPRDRVQEIAVRQVIAAIDSAGPKNVNPPRRKPVPATRPPLATKTAEPPRRKPPRPVAELEGTAKAEVKPNRASARPTLGRLVPAAEVARVLKTLKAERAAGTEADAEVEMARELSRAVTTRAEISEPILAAVTTGDAAHAANSAPAVAGAASGNAAPRYPYAARLRGVEGDVLLRVVVLPSGTAADVTLRLTSGSALLDRAARDAVRTWRFRPAKRAGQTVVGWVDVPVSFRLTD